MAADTYSPILGLLRQATGNNNNNWGDMFNNSTSSPLERSIAGVAVRSNTGGALDLSGSPPPASLRQDVDAIQLFNGALTEDLTVTVPNISKTWWFHNATTGDYFLYVKTPTGNPIQIPQGCCRLALCYGDSSGVLIRQDIEDVGTIRISAKPDIGPGELACDGSTVLKTAYPDLFTAIGLTWTSPATDDRYFTLPNFTDTGRFLRSASGTLTVGTYQSNQNQAHSHSATTGVSASTGVAGDHFHSAGISDPGHAHTILNVVSVNAGFNGSIGQGGTPINAPAISTSPSTTGVRLNSSNGLDTTYSAGGHTHAITASATTTVASSGGNESRPESAVVTFGIRY